MIWHFDHRFGSYSDADARGSSTHLPTPTPQEYADPTWLAQPWYWVPAAEVAARLRDTWQRLWFVAYRRITNATNERTVITSIMPVLGAADPAMVMLPTQATVKHAVCLAAQLNSSPFDFAARQKIGGTDLRNHYFKQLPVLPPDRYTAADLAFIVPRVLELVYTAWDIQPFADDVWRESLTPQSPLPEGEGAHGGLPSPAGRGVGGEGSGGRGVGGEGSGGRGVGGEGSGGRGVEGEGSGGRGVGGEGSGGRGVEGEGLRAAIEAQWRENAAATGGGHSGAKPPEWAEIAADGFPHPPFKWDEDRRAVLRAELDAYYARLYGLTEEELRYILDPADVYGPDFPGETFRVLKEKEIRQYGEYRTRRLVLEAWGRLEG
jgi:hypothetical protein